MKNLYLLFLVLIFSFQFGNAQVLINEFSASNLEGFQDNYGKTEDWIELYNAGDSPVNIGGWHLSDKSSKPGKWQIPLNTIIEAKSFLLFWCSGRDEAKNGHFHTNFKLSQTTGKDKVVLSSKDENIVQKFDLELTHVEHSRCRAMDGATRWSICTEPTPGSSNNNTEQYLFYTEVPQIDLPAGYYNDPVVIRIQNNELNSVLRYTVDGSLPTNDSPQFIDSLIIEETTVLKARSFSNDQLILPGKIAFNTYFINEDFTVPVFSVASEDVIDLANGDGGIIPIGTLEYFNTSKEREASSYGSLNRHGQDSWVLPHRSLDWISRDEMAYSKEIVARLFDYSDRDEYQRIMFRNSGDDNYPALPDNAHQGSAHIRDEYVQTLALEGNMRLDTRAVKRVVLFLNGQYWGLYGMRERPVDHDYTEYYYGQDKYNLHYLTTWGSTEAEYGGLDAFDEWYSIRDFILENDMGEDQNYERVKKEIDLLSFVDYFIVNLNVVAKDWLNYNTAWWKGLDPNEGHTKWGYNLWDLDATFDYYINYTGIPNDGPDAVPCDIEAISNYMDWFFKQNSGGIEHPEDCVTILNGTCPYPSTDTVFIQVINQDEYCCNNNWDNICQEQYDLILNDTLLLDTCMSILNGSCSFEMDDPVFIKTVQNRPSCCTGEWDEDCQALYDEIKVELGNEKVKGNVGKHEKLFLKMQEESTEFREFYYRRLADMMNTVFSCDNMMGTLDSMIAIIEAEMPRQIERWGGSMQQWEENVEELREFIRARCTLLDEGMIECFDLEGPFQLTLVTEPPNMGQMKINTIDVPTLPWEANYFGMMKNIVRVLPENAASSDYKFTQWESRSLNTQIDDPFEMQSSFELQGNDTLVAVFKLKTATEDLSDKPEIEVYPNPVKEELVLRFKSNSYSGLKLELFDVRGTRVYYAEQTAMPEPGINTIENRIPIRQLAIAPGVYLLKLFGSDELYSKRIVVLE